MFRQLVTPGPGGSGNVNDNINSLFSYHPLQTSAIVETVWLNRNNASQTSSPFIPWAPRISYPILNAPFFPGYDWSPGGPTPLPPGAGITPPPPNFVPPLSQPGIANTWDGVSAFPPTGFQSTNWDHGIFAYLVENTGIYEIFSKVLETYMFTGDLEPPSPASQHFWRNLEYLIYGDAMPSMVWTTSGRLRRDETANRMTLYYMMFGLDLSHAAELAVQHPYQKPAAANREFIPTFEAFAREVWRGIVNVKNFSGANDTDATVIATLARRLFDMMATLQINGDWIRELFRADAILSYLYLAILYDSPAVVDLKATASSPEMRLRKIGERVNKEPHKMTKPLLDLAAPFSFLMQAIETGSFNDATGAATLYIDPTQVIAQTAEQVIDQYALATGRPIKESVPLTRPKPAPPVAVRQQGAPPQLAAPRPNGHAVTPRQ
jgi:hypothetical protein